MQHASPDRGHFPPGQHHPGHYGPPGGRQFGDYQEGQGYGPPGGFGRQENVGFNERDGFPQNEGFPGNNYPNPYGQQRDQENWNNSNVPSHEYNTHNSTYEQNPQYQDLNTNQISYNQGGKPTRISLRLCQSRGADVHKTYLKINYSGNECRCGTQKTTDKVACYNETKEFSVDGESMEIILMEDKIGYDAQLAVGTLNINTNFRNDWSGWIKLQGTHHKVSNPEVLVELTIS